MAASMSVRDALNVALRFVNKPRRGERRSLRTDNCGLAGQRSGPCGTKKKKSRLFSKTLSSPAVPFPDLFFTGLCGFCFTEERRTFVDMWTSLDTFSRRAACAQKCLRLQFWAFFNTIQWRARTVGPVFSAVLFPVFLVFSLYQSTVKCKKKFLSLLELRTFNRFRLYNRKIGLLKQKKRSLMKKWKVSKRRFVRVVAFLAMFNMSWASKETRRAYLQVWCLSLIFLETVGAKESWRGRTKSWEKLKKGCGSTKI